METYSRIGLLRSYGNLQSYWTTTKLWKLTVVLDYYEAMETYSRIGVTALNIEAMSLLNGADAIERANQDAQDLRTLRIMQG